MVTHAVLSKTSDSPRLSHAGETCFTLWFSATHRDLLLEQDRSDVIIILCILSFDSGFAESLYMPRKYIRDILVLCERHSLLLVPHRNCQLTRRIRPGTMEGRTAACGLISIRIWCIMAFRSMISSTTDDTATSFSAVKVFSSPLDEEVY